MGLHELQPDIAVIPECSQADADALKPHGYSSLWFGANKKKGLAVIAGPKWTIRSLPASDGTWIVPIQISGPESFLLIAVWALHDTKERYAGYVKQIMAAMTANPQWFENGPVVVAGDFNSSSMFDSKIKGDNHASIVKLLEEKGLVSSYHVSHRNSGESPTFHLYRHEDKGFHIDYIFIPALWQGRILSSEVGSWRDWRQHSDHCPVSIELA